MSINNKLWNSSIHIIPTDKLPLKDASVGAAAGGEGGNWRYPENNLQQAIASQNADFVLYLE